MTTFERVGEQVGGILRRAALDRLGLARGAARLHLAERAEQHVGERAVHRPAHDDREDQARRPVERAGGDQQLVVEHEAHRHRRQAGVRVQQRDDRRHVGAADREDQQHAEDQRQPDDDREQLPAIGREDDQHARDDRDAEQHEVHEVLPAIGNRPGRDHLLQLAGGHQAAGERQIAEDAPRRRARWCGTPSASRRPARSGTRPCRPGRRRGRRMRARARSAAARPSAARGTAGCRSRCR